MPQQSTEEQLHSELDAHLRALAVEYAVNRQAILDHAGIPLRTALQDIPSELRRSSHHLMAQVCIGKGKNFRDIGRWMVKCTTHDRPLCRIWRPITLPISPTRLAELDEIRLLHDSLPGRRYNTKDHTIVHPPKPRRQRKATRAAPLNLATQRQDSPPTPPSAATSGRKATHSATLNSTTQRQNPPPAASTSAIPTISTPTTPTHSNKRRRSISDNMGGLPTPPATSPASGSNKRRRVASYRIIQKDGKEVVDMLSDSE